MAKIAQIAGREMSAASRFKRAIDDIAPVTSGKTIAEMVKDIEGDIRTLDTCETFEEWRKKHPDRLFPDVVAQVTIRGEPKRETPEKEK